MPSDNNSHCWGICRQTRISVCDSLLDLVKFLGVISGSSEEGARVLRDQGGPQRGYQGDQGIAQAWEALDLVREKFESKSNHTIG